MTASRLDEERVLSELGAMIREDDGDRALLERLCDSDLSPEQREQLKARAAESPALARALDAYKPLDPQEKQRIAALFTARAAQPDAASAPARRSFASRFRHTATAATLMAAAVVLGWVAWPTGVQTELPDYELSARGTAQQRGGGPIVERVVSPGDVVTVAPDLPLYLWLRPARALDASIGRIDASVCLRSGSGCKALPAAIDVGPQGAVSIELAAIGAALAQRAELVVLLGRAETLHDRNDELASGADGRGSDWVRWIVQLQRKAD